MISLFAEMILHIGQVPMLVNYKMKFCQKKVLSSCNGFTLFLQKIMAVPYGGKLWQGKIWQIMWKRAVGKIKLGEKLSFAPAAIIN